MGLVFALRVVAGVQVLRAVGVAEADCGACDGASFIFWLRLLNGELKKPLFFFCTVLSSPLVDMAERFEPLYAPEAPDKAESL